MGKINISPPTKELMKLVPEKRITHGAHPVLRWMMDNIFIRTDSAGNIKAIKEKSTEKIDGTTFDIEKENHTCPPIAYDQNRSFSLGGRSSFPRQTAVFLNKKI